MDNQAEFSISDSPGGDSKCTVDANDNNYMVTWTSRDVPYNNGYNDRHWMQQYDFQGDRMGIQWQGPSRGGSQGFDLGENGDFVISSHEYGGGTTVAKYDSAYNTILPETGIGGYGPSSSVILDNGNFAVVFMGGYNIYLQMFDVAGNKLGNLATGAPT